MASGNHKPSPKEEKLKIQTLLRDTMMLMCKNSLSYSSELCVEAIVGITIDKEFEFHFSINETQCYQPEKKDTNENAVSSAGVSEVGRKRKLSGNELPEIAAKNVTVDVYNESYSQNSGSQPKKATTTADISSESSVNDGAEKDLMLLSRIKSEIEDIDDDRTATGCQGDITDFGTSLSWDQSAGTANGSQSAASIPCHSFHQQIGATPSSCTPMLPPQDWPLSTSCKVCITESTSVLLYLILV